MNKEIRETAIEMLDHAQRKIDTPEKHCRINLAQDAKGIPCDPKSAKALKFCSYGSINSIQYEYPEMACCHAMANLTNAANILGHHGVGVLNDNESHETVMDMFEMAKSRIRKELK